MRNAVDDTLSQLLRRLYFVGMDGVLYTPIARAADRTVRVGRCDRLAAAVVVPMQRQTHCRIWLLFFRDSLMYRQKNRPVTGSHGPIAVELPGSAGRSGFDYDGGLHHRVDLAEVRVGSRLVEGVAEGIARGQL